MLWSLAISHECKFGDLERAKSLFYQAIGSCPWSKGIFSAYVDLYLMPFNEIRGGFTDAELDDLFGIMEEKEIRVFQIKE